MRLKTRYGSQFLIETLFNHTSGEVVSVSEFMHSQLSDQAGLVEQHNDCCVFCVPITASSNKQDLTISKVFTELGKWKDKLGFASYCVNQPTLEQVFIRLAQEPGRGEGPPGGR